MKNKMHRNFARRINVAAAAPLKSRVFIYSWRSGHSIQFDFFVSEIVDLLAQQQEQDCAPDRNRRKTECVQAGLGQ
jgi:hypothetical protein